ncbi:hypothetical protein F2Q68_00033815 [Brassica cretica]|uniref:Uncharacterized protein n=1 Tax=Brassica cretica TaxID=69181 RepID=A0A8S9H4G3_BRACR|nr:hypothetical protein F2Q68_00033815 [Brassica cretica]
MGNLCRDETTRETEPQLEPPHVELVTSPQQCSSRRDEAVATDHTTIGARKKKLEPPEVLSPRACEIHAPPPKIIVAAAAENHCRRRRRKSSSPPPPDHLFAAAISPPRSAVTAGNPSRSPPTTSLVTRSNSPVTRSTRPSELSESTRLTRLTVGLTGLISLN